MSPHSAYLGEPPANDDDRLIIRAFAAMASLNGKDLVGSGKGFPVRPKPPPGYVHESETRVPLMYGYTLLAIFLMVFATIARIIIRMRTYKLRVGWDDWMIMFATLFAISNPLTTIVRIRWGGLGKHNYDTTYSEFAYFNSAFPFTLMSTYIPLSLIKMSIILFYMRLNGFTSRNWMITHWTLFAVVTALLFLGVFGPTFICPNVAEQWNYRLYAIHEGPFPRCTKRDPVLNTTNALHATTDAALLVVPIAMLWKVQMRWTTKLRVWLVGLIGLVNITLTILRTVILSRSLKGLQDYSWYYPEINVWSISEVTLATITASLPILSTPVINFFRKHIRPRLRKSNSRSPLRGHNGVNTAGNGGPPRGGNYVFEKARRLGGNFGRKWPGGRNQHEDGISLGGATTVDSDALVGEGRGHETSRWRAESNEDGDTLELGERKIHAEREHRRDGSDGGSQETDVESGEVQNDEVERSDKEGAVFYDHDKGTFMVSDRAV